MGISLLLCSSGGYIPPVMLLGWGYPRLNLSVGLSPFKPLGWVFLTVMLLGWVFLTVMLLGWVSPLLMSLRWVSFRG